MRRVHGVRGAWAVESLTDAPEAIFASGALLFAGDREGQLTLTDGAPTPLHIEDGRPMNRDWLVRVREITDRDVADVGPGDDETVGMDRIARVRHQHDIAGRDDGVGERRDGQVRYQ